MFHDNLLLASSGNNDEDDFMQYIDFGDSPSPGDPNESPGGEPSESSNQNKTDTDRLHDFLKPYENKWVKDSKINLKNRVDHSTTAEDKKLYEMSKIFAHVKKENPSFFTKNEYSHPVDTRLTKEFLEKINNLKKNYPDNWPKKS